MSKQERNVRYETSTLDKVEYVAEKQGINESELFRRLVHSSRSIDRLYREWKRIEREVASLPGKDKKALQDRQDALFNRLDDLSPAEERLLDAIQAELRERVTGPVEVAEAA